MLFRLEETGSLKSICEKLFSLKHYNFIGFNTEILQHLLTRLRDVHYLKCTAMDYHYQIIPTRNIVHFYKYIIYIYIILYIKEEMCIFINLLGSGQSATYYSYTRKRQCKKAKRKNGFLVSTFIVAY